MDTSPERLVGVHLLDAHGSRILRLDGRQELGRGDHLDIPAHTRHRVAWTTPEEPTIWLAVRYDGGE